MDNSLIKRQDAIEAVTKYCTKHDLRDLLADLEVLPSEEQEQKTGKWLTPKEYWRRVYEATGERYLPAPTGLESFVYCSQCGETSWFINKYCPHCGSRNRGEEE